MGMMYGEYSATHDVALGSAAAPKHLCIFYRDLSPVLNISLVWVLPLCACSRLLRCDGRHVAERHRRAGWVVGVHLINSKGPVECPKSVKQQESCDDAECKDYGSERVLGVAGHDRSLAHQARSAPCQAQPIINDAGAT